MASWAADVAGAVVVWAGARAKAWNQGPQDADFTVVPTLLRRLLASEV